MKTLIKIDKAIVLIKSKNLKKKGKNKFSNYDYYTPEQVSELTTFACHEVKLLTKFDLIRNELGITGKLSIYDLESDESPVIYDMASAIPEIKATNISQQLGGAMTYTKRYLLMNAFDITDNNLDFDTTENTKKQSESIPEQLKKVILNCKSNEELTKLYNNNKEIQSNKEFIQLLSKQKQILKQNGISN